jgi:hypothetical protein
MNYLVNILSFGWGKGTHHREPNIKIRKRQMIRNYQKSKKVIG